MASAASADRPGDLSGDGDPADEVGRAPGDVARELGVAVVTLRSWERRYGIGPASRQPGRHRRYLPADVARLRRMCELIGNGMSPARAADIVRYPAEGRVEPNRSGARDRPATPVGGGGAAAVRGLLRTAERMDDLGCRRLLQREIAHRHVIGAWERLMLPALVAIGDRHAASGRWIEVEHLLSVTISAALAAVRRPRRSSARSGIVLACADEEQHSLALEALAAAMAEHGAGVRLLGARTPPEALHDALRSTRATSVVIWSQLPDTGDVRQLERIRAARAAPVLVAAGPGWPVDRLPAGVHRPRSLTEAVDLLRRHAPPDHRP